MSINACHIFPHPHSHVFVVLLLLSAAVKARFVVVWEWWDNEEWFC